MNDVQGAADRDLALSVVVMGYRNRDTIVRAVRSVVDQASPGLGLDRHAIDGDRCHRNPRLSQ